MGFKRTSEGRVYFQRRQNIANTNQGRGGDTILPNRDTEFEIRDNRPLSSEPEERAPGDMPRQRAKPARDLFGQTAPMQTEILALLKSLNERLKTTQTERNQMRKQMETYRALLEELDHKASRNEQSYMTLQDKVSRPDQSSENRAARAEQMARETLKELAETRKLLLSLENKTETAHKNLTSVQKTQKQYSAALSERDDQFETLSRRLEQTEHRQSEIGDQIEETITNQARLIRKVDKAIEDRARFMRKIERIEDAVIQTRDALNAKAMVLLTDKGVAAQTDSYDMDIDEEGEADLPDALLARKVLEQTRARPEQETNEIRDFLPMRSYLYTMGAAALAAVLIAWAAWIMFGTPSATNTDGTTSEINYSTPSVDRSLSAYSPESGPEAGLMTASSAPEERIADTPSPPPAAALPTPATTPETGAVDDIGTLDLNDGDALLNALEENPDAVARTLNDIEPSYAAQEPSTPAGVTPEPAPEPQAPEIVAPKQTAEKGTATPDETLPEIIKKVEAEAFKGVPEAQHDLGAIYIAGHGNVKQDYERAAYWFEQAAQGGIANAAYNLGVLYHQGLGVSPDIKEAIVWYNRAADAGHPEAQYNLGIAYIEGIGVTYNPQQADAYFKKAAAGGIMEAAYNLGLIYENGLLGQSKPDEALAWYKAAADKGSPEARAALEQLARNLGIDLEDVNRLADTVKSRHSALSAPATPYKAPTNPPVAANTIEAETPPPAALSIQEDDIAITADIAVQAPRIMDSQPDRNTQTLKTTQILVAQVQDHLINRGLLPGPANGFMGQMTRDAIRSYQSAHNLQITGSADQTLLQHMLQYEPREEFGSRE